MTNAVIDGAVADRREELLVLERHERPRLAFQLAVQHVEGVQRHDPVSFSGEQEGRGCGHSADQLLPGRMRDQAPVSLFLQVERLDALRPLINDVPSVRGEQGDIDLLDFLRLVSQRHDFAGAVFGRNQEHLGLLKLAGRFDAEQARAVRTPVPHHHPSLGPRHESGVGLSHGNGAYLGFLASPHPGEGDATAVGRENWITSAALVRATNGITVLYSPPLSCG